MVSGLFAWTGPGPALLPRRCFSEQGLCQHLRWDTWWIITDGTRKVFVTAIMVSFSLVMSGAVYPGSGFVEEALQRAIELTDAAYARTSER